MIRRVGAYLLDPTNASTTALRSSPCTSTVVIRVDSPLSRRTAVRLARRLRAHCVSPRIAIR
jgi:hypothetical protein